MNQHPIIKNNCFFPTFTMFFPLVFTKVSSIPTSPGLQFRLRFHLPQHSASAPPRRRREGGAQGGQGQGQGATWGGHGKVPVQRCEQLGFTGEILKTWWFQMVQDILNLFLFRDWRNVIQYGSKLQTDLWFAGWLAPMIGWSLQCCSFFCGLSIAAERCRNLCYMNMTQKMLWDSKVTICYPLPYTKVLRSKQLPHHPLSTPNWVVQRRRTGSTWNASASGFSHFSSVKSIGGIGHFHIQHISTFTCTWLITRNSKSFFFLFVYVIL